MFELSVCLNKVSVTREMDFDLITTATLDAVSVFMMSLITIYMCFIAIAL